MIRLFTGIAIDPAIAQRLAQLGGGIPGARWVPAADMHVTLVFVGELDEAAAADLNDALTTVRLPAFDMTIAGLNTFGHSKPHTLWAGVEASPDLTHLQTKVTQMCRQLDIAIERRKFVPHLTLARLSEPSIPRLQSFISDHSPLRGGTFRVDCFSLFQSHLTASGSSYDRLMDYPLG